MFEFNVEVVNLDDLGCPSLASLRQQTQLNTLKSCSFNHNSVNCAYINAYVLLQWWNMEQIILKRLEKVYLAIKECQFFGYGYTDTDLVKYLPKHFIMYHSEEIEMIYDKLPNSLKTDIDIVSNMRCDEHHLTLSSDTSYDGPRPKRKHCYFCSHKLLSLKKKN